MAKLFCVLAWYLPLIVNGSYSAPCAFHDEDLLQLILELPPQDELTVEPQTVVKLCSQFLATPEKGTSRRVMAVLKQRALAYVRLGDMQKAQKDAEELCRLAPKDAVSRCIRAATLRGIGKTEQSLVEAKEATRLAPEYAPAHVALGFALLEQGDHNAALDAANRAVSLNPKFATALYLRGFISFQKNAALDCLRDMNRCLELSPFPQKDWTATAFYCRGVSLAMLNRPKEGLASLLMAFKLNPTASEVAGSIAEVCGDLGKFHMACHYAEKCVHLDREAPNGYGLCAEYYSKLGNGKKAMERLKTYLRYPKLDPIILSAAARAYFDLGDYQAALDCLDKALDLDSKRPWSRKYPWSLIGKASLLATCPDAKFRDGAKAVSLASDAYQNQHVRPWYRWAPAMVLAEAHAEAGDFKQAIQFAKEAIEAAGPDFGRKEEFAQKLSFFEKRTPWRAKSPGGRTN